MKTGEKQHCQHLTKVYLDKLRHTGNLRIQDCWIPDILKDCLLLASPHTVQEKWNYKSYLAKLGQASMPRTWQFYLTMKQLFHTLK